MINIEYKQSMRQVISKTVLFMCVLALLVPAVKAQETRPAKPAELVKKTTGKPILLNFKDAPIDTVLEYLSEKAGLVIVQEARVGGRVTVMSRQPINAKEAVALLDTVLKEKGYTAVHIGRNVRIVSIQTAAKANLPVHTGSDPAKIPVADKMVTQIIPIKYAEATGLQKDLAPLLSDSATLTSNASSNSLILIDTQANIKRIVEIISAIDAHMAGTSDIKVFPLKYADAASTATLITTLFKQPKSSSSKGQKNTNPFMRFMQRGRGGKDKGSGGGRVEQQAIIASADTRTNTIVVSAPPESMSLIESVIKELDANQSENQSVFLYPLKNAQADKVEDILNQIFSESYSSSGSSRSSGRSSRTSSRNSRRPQRTAAAQKVAAESGDLIGQVFFVADEDTNSLLVRAPSKHFDRVKKVIAELDKEIPQVLIKVLIVEVIHNDLTDIGGQFSVLNLHLSTTAGLKTDLGGTETDSDGGLVTSTVTAGFSATYNALKKLGRIDVLSRPYILASDNQEARITVGQEVPFIRSSRTTETGQTINTIEYEDVGIILKVTPQVNPDGKVIMDVAPEISSVTDTTVPISETVNATIYAKRSAKTRVAINNGQTIVIGGLMEDRFTDSVRKVPVLGDIPGAVGDLFRRTYKDKVKTELLLFITPHVVRRSTDLQKVSDDEKSGMQSIDSAAGEGKFQEHIKGMQRGAMPDPVAVPEEKKPKE